MSEETDEKKAARKISISDMPIEEALKVLNKKFGANTFVLASMARGTEVRYNSTGVYALDFALGGGFPENRVTELHGAYSSFKSTVSLTALAEFQKNRPKGFGVYLDLERSFDRSYARKLGVKLSRTIVVDPDTGEQAVDGLSDILNLKTPLFVIIDSLAAMRPSKELEETMDQQFMGLHARMVSRAMGIINSRMKRDLCDVNAVPVTVLVLNQVRDTIGPYKAPESTPGGRAKDFFYSVTVRLSATSANEVSENVQRNGITKKIRFGQQINFKVKKNKTSGPQNEEGSFNFYERDYDGHEALTFDNIDALYHYGSYHDLITYNPTTGYKFGKISAKKEKEFISRFQGISDEDKDILYFGILDKVNPQRK